MKRVYKVKKKIKLIKELKFLRDRNVTLEQTIIDLYNEVLG